MNLILPTFSISILKTIIGIFSSQGNFSRIISFFISYPRLNKDFLKNVYNFFWWVLSFILNLEKFIYSNQELPVHSSTMISARSSLGVSSQLMNLFRSVNAKAFLGTAVISVLSQMTPAKVRLIRICLPCLVKLPAWFLWVKKKRSPFLDLKNWVSEI